MKRQMQKVLNALQGKRWNWPDEQNRWQTGKPKVTASPKTRFTATGPSKRTKNKRAAKALRGRH